MYKNILCKNVMQFQFCLVVIIKIICTSLMFVVVVFLNRCKPYGPGHAKMCLMHYANNKDADQPAHPRSLISAFVVRALDSIISFVSRYEISRF